MNIDDIDFYEVLPGGRTRYRRLESGAVRDESTGRIVAREITSEQAREMVNGRWDKWRKANASAILKEAQAIDPDIKTEQEALAMAAGKTFVAIMDSEKPRADDLVKLSQLAGAYPTIADVKQVAPASPNDTAYYLLREIARFAAKVDIIDGEVKDVSGEG